MNADKILGEINKPMQSHPVGFKDQCVIMVP